MKKNFLEPGAFYDKRFCKNWQACNFFPIRLKMTFPFLNGVDIQLILEFKKSFENIFFQSFLKILNTFFSGAFLDKKFCKNLRACNFFAIWLRMLISFLKCGYKTDFRIQRQFWKILSSLSKKLRCEKFWLKF